MDTLEKQKPTVGVGPCLSLLPLIFLLLIIMDITLKGTISTRPKGVHLRER